MMHEVDIETGMLFQNQIAIGRALVVERIVRHRGERGLQSGKSLERGLRARIFLAIERKAAILAANRNKALVEIAALDRGGCPPPAFKAPCRDVLPPECLPRPHGK